MHLPTNPHRHCHACVPVAVLDSHGGLFMCRLIAFMAPVNGAGCFNEHSGGPLRPPPAAARASAEAPSALCTALHRWLIPLPRWAVPQEARGG